MNAVTQQHLQRGDCPMDVLRVKYSDSDSNSGNKECLMPITSQAGLFSPYWYSLFGVL